MEAAAASTQQPAGTKQRSAPTQGELVSRAMMRAPEPLVDIGINLTNEAFHKVRGRVQDSSAQARSRTQDPETRRARAGLV